MGALGFVFPRETLLRSAPAEPSLSKALHECLLSRGPNTTLLYYIAPALAFVLLYSILPHKVPYWADEFIHLISRTFIFEKFMLFDMDAMDFLISTTFRVGAALYLPSPAAADHGRGRGIGCHPAGRLLGAAVPAEPAAPGPADAQDEEAG
jgi:hypothetical protein